MARASHFIFLLGVLGFVACDREETAEPEHDPTIIFRTDSGFVFQSDTLPLSDTIQVGVVITPGDDRLRTFKVLVAYDEGPRVVVDSLEMDNGRFTFDKTIITRNVAGTEEWRFWVQERDGDIFHRALTFRVQ